VYILFSIMLKENLITSYHDVMPAVAKFVGERTFEGFTQELPADMQDIFERFMETDHANDLKMREKVMRCLNLIRQFSITMAPFTTDQVYEACKEQGYE
jgi:hypothetical protein